MAKHNILKPNTFPIQSRAELEALVGEITHLKLRLKQAAGAQDAAVVEARQSYAAELANLEEAIVAKSSLAQAWAQAHPEEFGGARRLELDSASLGWRWGQPQLKTMRGWGWEQVLERLKSWSNGGPYVRSRDEVNKQMLLGDRTRLGAEILRGLGLRVVQEENFYIEPKLRQVENRVSPPCA